MLKPAKKRPKAYDSACRGISAAVARRGSQSSGIFKWVFTPILAPLLGNRWLIGILAGAGIIVVFLSGLNGQGWKCPIHAAVGITCPGCGLTTAVVLLLQGNFKSAIDVHAFAPVAILFLAFMVVAGLLPTDTQHKLARRMAVLEKSTGMAAIGLLSMVAYWFLRLFEIL